MAGSGRAIALTAVLSLGALTGCGSAIPEPSDRTEDGPSLAASPSVTAGTPDPSPIAAGEALVPGTYADVMTSDVVLRSAPGLSAESVVYPDRLHAPMSVYVADGPVVADGQRWYLVVGFDEHGSQPGLNGWAAAEGASGEPSMRPRAPAEGAWEELRTDAPPSDVSTRSSALGADGRIYFFGNWPPADGDEGPAWALDPSIGEWDALAPMEIPRERPVVAADGDRFYVIGGVADGATVSDDGPSAMEIYEAQTDRWQAAPPVQLAETYGGSAMPPSPTGDHTAIAHDELAWLFTSRGTLVFDGATRAWRPSRAGSTGGVPWAAVGSETTAYVMDYGGTVRRFDPIEERFGEQISPPAISRFKAGLAVDSGGRIFVVGGSAEPGPETTCSGWRSHGEALSAIPLVEIYDPESGRWTVGPPLPVGLHEVAAFGTADGLLVVGRTAEPDNEVYIARLESEFVLAADGAFQYTTQVPSPTGCG